MAVYLNFLKVTIFHAQWDPPLLEKSVYLVIDHQCCWICLLVRELKLVQSLEHTCELSMVIVHQQTWKLLCRFVSITTNATNKLFSLSIKIIVFVSQRACKYKREIKRQRFKIPANNKCAVIYGLLELKSKL